MEPITYVEGDARKADRPAAGARPPTAARRRTGPTGRRHHRDAPTVDGNGPLCHLRADCSLIRAAAATKNRVSSMERYRSTGGTVPWRTVTDQERNTF